MNAGLDEVVIELIDDASAARLELLEVGVGPPVSQAAKVIELSTLIVEAVRNLVADNHTDGAVIHGVDCGHIKPRRLQDAGGKNYFVPERVVIRVRSRRCHAPAAAVHRLTDPFEVVLHHEAAS